MPVLVLARFAQIQYTSTGVICMTVYWYWHCEDNINTSIGMKKMPVLELARLAEIKITSTGIICMTVVLVLAFFEKKMPVPVRACPLRQYQYWHRGHACTGIGKNDVLHVRTGIVGIRTPVPV